MVSKNLFFYFNVIYIFFGNSVGISAEFNFANINRLVATVNYQVYLCARQPILRPSDNRLKVKLFKNKRYRKVPVNFKECLF